MNTLPPPFDSFRLEKRPGEYKDFQIEDGDPYPLKGVTFPTNYGDIAGYTGEDNHPLDLFIGTGELLGYIIMYRPDIEGDLEHKFYLNLTEDEETSVLKEFEPVLRGHGRFKSLDELQKAIEPFKDKS
ncbi:MAG: hypothetical protein JWS12_512 [Candidatus Saccharibacteria bacterium]|nr:hypothetical protein [Candidatus Saccharibacteria bacterium]